jgi:SAM-dependent methyltransferase
MSLPPSSPGLPLGSDGYPAASAVGRRPAGPAESARANRRWWDAAAAAYLAEHEADLGEVDFLWGPEGLREADARLLGEVAGRRVLEVGCGSAPCARWLRRQGADVVAFDLSAGMLSRAASLNRSTGLAVPLVQADVAALPFASGSFEIACSSFGGLPFVADVEGALREVARVLRPGGRLGVVANVHDAAVDWVRDYTEIIGRGDAPPPADREPVLDHTFGPLETFEVGWEQPMTIEDLVTLTASRSNVLAMAQDERARLLADVEHLARTHPDLAGRERFDLPYRTRAWRATRR